MRSRYSRTRLAHLYALGLGWVALLAVSLAMLGPALTDIYGVLGVEGVGLQIATTKGIALALATTAAATTAWATRGSRAEAPQATRASAPGATASANA